MLSSNVVAWLPLTTSVRSYHNCPAHHRDSCMKSCEHPPQKEDRAFLRLLHKLYVDQPGGLDVCMYIEWSTDLR